MFSYDKIYKWERDAQFVIVVVLVVAVIFSYVIKAGDIYYKEEEIIAGT